MDAERGKMHAVGVQGQRGKVREIDIRAGDERHLLAVVEP